jgi:hypothetical protein
MNNHPRSSLFFLLTRIKCAMSKKTKQCKRVAAAGNLQYFVVDDDDEDADRRGQNSRLLAMMGVT